MDVETNRPSESPKDVATRDRSTAQPVNPVPVTVSVQRHRPGLDTPSSSHGAGTAPVMPTQGPLVDRYGRIHDDLRISVTDRCNLRCVYCMPEEGLSFLAREKLLTFEEITPVWPGSRASWV